MFSSESARKALPKNYTEYFKATMEKHGIDQEALSKMFKEIKKEWPGIKAKIAKKSGKTATASTMFAFGDEDEDEDENTIFARDLDVDVLFSGSTAYNYLIDEYVSEQDDFEATASNEAAAEARKLGLKYFKFGRWGNPKTRKITHRTVNGKLLELEKANEIIKASKAYSKLGAAGTKHLKKIVSLQERHAKSKNDATKAKYAKEIKKSSQKLVEVDKKMKDIEGNLDTHHKAKLVKRTWNRKPKA